MSLKPENLLKLIETQKPELTNLPTYTAFPLSCASRGLKFMKIGEIIKVTRPLKP